MAIKELYPKTKIAIGPALNDRFYYDIDFPEFISNEDLEKIESKMMELSKEDFEVEKVNFNKKDAYQACKRMAKYGRDCFVRL